MIFPRTAEKTRRHALMTSGLFAQLLSASSAFAATVSHVKVTKHPANDHSLSLSFDLTANGQEYTVFITGIRSSAAPSLWADALAQQIADSFAQGKTLRIANKATGKANEYVETHIDLMDAEKQNLTAIPDWEPGEVPAFMSDSQLCWAASASNALELSGWGRAMTKKHPGKVNFKNEDDIFAYFPISSPIPAVWQLRVKSGS